MTVLVSRNLVFKATLAVASMIVWAGLAAGAAPPAEPAHIEIDPQTQIGSVNRLVLGSAIAAPKLHLRHAKEANDWGCGVWDPEKRESTRSFVVAGEEAGIGLLRMGCVLRNWKEKLVGPPENRPVQFGLLEFLRYCGKIGAAPVLIVDALESMPQDAADLVEYLNAPHDGSNIGGGTDWAARRAADGHPAPLGVVWFEFGNEFYAGAGKKIKRLGLKGYGDLAEHYARRYLAFRKAMKAVDPHIKLGANIQYPIWPWNKPILQIAGRQIDFGIPHFYTPQPSGKDRDLMMESFAASAAEIQLRFDKLNEHVKTIAGRTDLPWMVTEYNCGAQSKPVVFRFTLANALNVAQTAAVMMRPRNRVLGANFWNFANEMWGIVRGHPQRGAPLLRHAPFFVFQLYREHFGDRLIRADIRCGQWRFAGGSGIPAQEVPDLMVNAAARSKPKADPDIRAADLTLMIVNTNLLHDVSATVRVRGWECLNHSQAEAWSLVGGAAWAVASPEDPSRVQVVRTAVGKRRSLWQITLPKHSVTAVEIHLRCLCPKAKKTAH